MKRKKHGLILLFLLLSITISSCRLIENEDPVVTMVPTTNAAPTEFPLATMPPSTSTPAVERPSPACFLEVGEAELVVETSGDYPVAILGYLNAAGSPIALEDELNFLGAAAQPHGVVVADFTGDGLDDVAVALQNPASPEEPSMLLIYGCVEEAYVLILNLPAGDLFFRGFRLIYWLDLDDDGAAELLVSQGSCGAHTCFEDLKLLAWDGSQFVNLLVGSTAELPFPDIRVADEGGDRIYEVEVSSGGFGSVGAGPQRTIVYTWRLDPDSGFWRSAEVKAAPSNFRIHVLHDADDAAAEAEYEMAVQLYRRVIEDESLNDWNIEGGNPALAAYAYYRIAVIAVALEDPAAVDTVLAEMEARFPVNDRLHVYVEMVILFRNAYASGGLGAACTAAAGFAESNARVVLEPLGSAFYGYANRDYLGESMCPAPEIAP